MHRPYLALLLAMAALAAGARGAAAQTLGERQTIAAEDAKLAEPLAITNTHCGTDLKAGIAWPDFLQHKDKLPFATGDCEAALQAIYLMCNSPVAKQAIAQKVKSLSCVLADGKQAMSMDQNGVLTLSIDLDGANYSMFVQKWLGDHL